MYPASLAILLWFFVLTAKAFVKLQQVSKDGHFHRIYQPSGVLTSLATKESNAADYYVRYWEDLLHAEHREAVDALRERRATWTRRRLEASGICLFDASAEPDSELFGEKIVRIYRNNGGDDGGRSLRDCYTQGDILIMTPTGGSPRQTGGASFQTRKRRMQAMAASKMIPREICVVDVGTDWMTASVGPSWPAGLWESRKHAGFYRVQLQKTVPQATLIAQKKALDLVRRGRAGKAASLLVGTFYDHQNNKPSTIVEAVSSEVPPRLEKNSDLEYEVSKAIEEAKNDIPNTFQPNSSQENAIAWALKRSLSCIRGPPGTGRV